jgi:hypothetical protein
LLAEEQVGSQELHVKVVYMSAIVTEVINYFIELRNLLDFAREFGVNDYDDSS